MEVSQKPFARKKPDQLVYLELGSGNGGMLLSISEDGFRFRAVSPLRPNGLMPFAFSFDGSRRVQGIGEVEWLEDDGKSGGMRFVEVSAEFRSAINQWLALDSPRSRPSREVTPAAATPLDTIEKIREELRRGYSGPPARKPSIGKEAPTENPEVPLPKSDAPPKKQDAEPQPRHPNIAADRAQPAQLSTLESSVAKTRQVAADFRPGPATTASERLAAEPPSRSPGTQQPDNDRKPRVEHSPPPFSPPPFSQAAEEESPASAEPTSWAFLRKPAPAPGSPIPPVRIPPAVSPTSEPAQALADAHASAEALRRPFRTEPSTSRTERPYIPPPDQSFEAAWERAKLTAPPEAPHLSRAAAGSIIGIALAVILGALAFNFRQDIGALVIDLGQKISGQNHASAPAPVVPGNKTESQATAEPANPQSALLNKPDAASSQTAPAQTASGASNPANTHSTPSPATHDPAAGRDASSSSTRDTTSSSVPSRAANSASTGATTTTTAPAQTTAGSLNTMIGTESGSGQEDFNAARELLRGDHRQRDLSKAVDLLWASVRKGYVPAEVTLADLYRRGDGVRKNCDQAQVLLVAASKKGSPEARHLLEQMAEEGCTE
jgi:hypothetical protein